jgi:hypothetical protein
VPLSFVFEPVKRLHSRAQIVQNVAARIGLVLAVEVGGWVLPCERNWGDGLRRGCREIPWASSEGEILEGDYLVGGRIVNGDD